jgi:hypothetical protein
LQVVLHDQDVEVSRGLQHGEHLLYSVPDDMLDAICIAGPPDDFAAKVQAVEELYAKAGIEELVFEPTSHGGVEMLAQSCFGIVQAAAML